MKKLIVITIFIFAGFSSCEKIKYYHNEPITNVKTKILSHKGGGNSEYQSNTFDAARFGLDHFDGIEVDVMLSGDRTVWLSHSSVLPECSGQTIDCFVESSDAEIIQLDSCLGNEYTFSKLDTVLNYLKNNYPEKTISIDVKGWIPCNVSTLGILGIMNVVGEEIIKLVTKYNLKDHVMVESETTTFLNFVKRHSSGIGIYLTTNGDFERGIGIALEEGYDGISFKYKFDEEITARHVEMIHAKGLRIQLWTVNEEADILEALSLNPDFIQTDNTEYFLNRQENP